MNKHASKTTIAATMLFAGFLYAGSASAGDIVKCVNGQGQVTLTDDVCPSGSKLNKVISTAAEPAAAMPVSAPLAKQESPERAALPRMTPRYVNVRTSSPVRGLTPDTLTLRTAKMQLQVVDTLRGQRMASLQ